MWLKCWKLLGRIDNGTWWWGGRKRERRLFLEDVSTAPLHVRLLEQIWEILQLIGSIAPQNQNVNVETVIVMIWWRKPGERKQTIRYRLTLLLVKVMAMVNCVSGLSTMPLKTRASMPFSALFLFVLFTQDIVLATQPPNIVLIVIDDLGKTSPMDPSKHFWDFPYQPQFVKHVDRSWIPSDDLSVSVCERKPEAHLLLDNIYTWSFFTDRWGLESFSWEPNIHVK